MQAPLVNPAYYIDKPLDLGLRIRRLIRRWQQRVQRSLDLLAMATQPSSPTWVDRAVFQMQYPAHLLRWLRTKTYTDLLSRRQYGGQRTIPKDLKRKRHTADPYRAGFGTESMTLPEPQLPAYLQPQSLVDSSYNDPDPQSAPNFVATDRDGLQNYFTSHRSRAMRRRI
jgi:hypothetical protein